MYLVNTSYVEVNGEYSRTFNMTAGVLQGSATSTILFMAYTADLVQLFNKQFPIEELIHTYHILLHADDCLILSNCRKQFEEKFRCLENYCVKNSIRLQPLKCCFLTINATECDNIALVNGSIKHSNEAFYLGSTLSSKGNVTYDVSLEINQRQKHFNRFYAFLRENYSAPLSVKEKVLEACVSSAVLYNCETWGDASVVLLEKMYRKALKYMLGVRSQVCNEFAYIELAKPTLKSVIQKRQFIFYKNCICDKDWPLQRYIIRKAIDARCSFINHYVKLGEVYASADDITKTSLDRLKEDVMKKANRGQSRYVSYLEINPTLDRPILYSSHFPTAKIHKTTQLRMISHSLQIELGRHKRPVVPHSERLCVCGCIETEPHFLFDCQLYYHIRCRYNIDKRTNRLNQVLDTNFTCDYINDLYDCRKIFMGT